MHTARCSVRPQLRAGRIIPLLVADTPLTALALHRAKAPAAAVGGFSISAVQARPDEGSMSRDEYLCRIEEILRAAPETAFVVDGESGFGDPESFFAEIARLPNAAVVFLEDQVTGDKRCGHMDRHAIVSVDEMQAIIRSAKRAQQNGEPMIMARTDARSAEGSIEAAIERGRAYAAAGADALFVEAPRSIEELKLIVSSFPQIPLLANIIEGGKTPELSAGELEELGFSFVVRPVAATLVYSRLICEMIEEFYGTGDLKQFYARHGKPALEEFRRLIGLSRL